MATRTISAAGGNFSATTAWDEGIVPVSGDTLVCRGGGDSGNLTIDATSPATGNLASIDFTNYSGTLAIGTQTLNVNGNVTLSGTMTITGTTGYLNVGASATLTSNGKTWVPRLKFTGTSTITLADDWSVTGRFDTATGTVTCNGQKITCAGGTTINATLNTGTTTLTITGGTWSTQGYCEWSTTLQGNVTCGTGANNPTIRNCTLTYASGTITTAGSTLNVGFQNATTVLDTAGVSWNIVNLKGGNNVQPSVVNVTSALLAATVTLGDGDIDLSGSTAGITCTTLNSATMTANRQTKLKYGQTYSVTGTLSIAGLSGKVLTLISSDGTNKVAFTFSGSTQSVDYVNATRIDSSGGTTIIDPHGVFTDSLNWSAASMNVNLIYRAKASA